VSSKWRGRVRQSARRLSRLSFVAERLPARVLYGPDFSATRSDIDRARADPQWAANTQERILSEVLHKASTTAYWRPLVLDALRMAPREAVGRLPVITKKEVRRSRNDMLADDPSTVDLVTTSGSSGDPLGVYLDKDRGAKEWAYVLLGGRFVCSWGLARGPAGDL
jgi:phenylacetate-CoA ligase